MRFDHSKFRTACGFTEVCHSMKFLAQTRISLGSQEKAEPRNTATVTVHQMLFDVKALSSTRAAPSKSLLPGSPLVLEEPAEKPGIGSAAAAQGSRCFRHLPAIQSLIGLNRQKPQRCHGEGCVPVYRSACPCLSSAETHESSAMFLHGVAERDSALSSE